MHIWKTSQREIRFDRTLVMAILNVTPDSFTDGGRYSDLSSAFRRVEALVDDGADIIDIGGESTRPGSERVNAENEIERVVPVITAIRERFDVPISIDTSKSAVAEAAIIAGAEIINDISGLRYDEQIAGVAVNHNAGLVLMHSRGSFETMHTQEPAADILTEVAADFRRSIGIAQHRGLSPEQIALDVGIGFGKTLVQNLELIAKIGKLAEEFPSFPLLVGASRKSFIGKILDGIPPDERLSGSLAIASIAAWNGADILRVHDVKETVECIKIVDAARMSARM
ncbi:MAG: dihydropteroate synthase [Acidobacteriota bacterium]